MEKWKYKGTWCVRTSGDLKDYTELFCKDCFESCPYYKIHG